MGTRGGWVKVWEGVESEGQAGRRCPVVHHGIPLPRPALTLAHGGSIETAHYQGIPSSNSRATQRVTGYRKWSAGRERWASPAGVWTPAGLSTGIITGVVHLGPPVSFSPQDQSRKRILWAGGPTWRLHLATGETSPHAETFMRPSVPARMLGLSAGARLARELRRSARLLCRRAAI